MEHSLLRNLNDKIILFLSKNLYSRLNIGWKTDREKTILCWYWDLLTELDENVECDKYQTFSFGAIFTDMTFADDI